MKKRYKVMTSSLNWCVYIRDLETDNTLNTRDICYLLNKQDKRINELNTKIVEEMQNSAKRRELIEYLMTELNKLTNELEERKQFYIDGISSLTEIINDLLEENEKLKSSLL